MKQQLQNYMDGAMAGEVIFGDFRNALRVIDGEAEARVNEDLGSYDNVKTIFDELLERYNETNKVCPPLPRFVDPRADATAGDGSCALR